MDTESNEIMALGLLADCEVTLGQLYTLFAEQSPELHDFWQRIAADERAHALWVRNLISYMRAEAISFQENRFQPDNFRTFLRYLQDRVSDARMNKLTNFAALSIAVDSEGTIVEKNFFEVLEGDTPEMRRILQTLAAASETHQQTVKAMWEHYRPQRV